MLAPTIVPVGLESGCTTAEFPLELDDLVAVVSGEDEGKEAEDVYEAVEADAVERGFCAAGDVLGGRVCGWEVGGFG